MEAMAAAAAGRLPWLPLLLLPLLLLPLLLLPLLLLPLLRSVHATPETDGLAQPALIKAPVTVAGCERNVASPAQRRVAMAGSELLVTLVVTFHHQSSNVSTDIIKATIRQRARPGVSGASWASSAARLGHRRERK